MQAALYYLGLACLFSHELDAVTHAEWQLLFGLRDLPEPAGRGAFVGLHVPLFFLVLWFSHHRKLKVREATRGALAAFMAVHAGLHFALSSTPAYTFHGTLSNALIAGAALAGIAYLVLWTRERHSGTTHEPSAGR